MEEEIIDRKFQEVDGQLLLAEQWFREHPAELRLLAYSAQDTVNMTASMVVMDNDPHLRNYIVKLGEALTGLVMLGFYLGYWARGIKGQS